MPKRFWQTVTVDRSPGGYSLALDGKPLRLPSGAPLLLTHDALAQAVAQEWQVVPENYDQKHLGLTGLAGAAQERIRPNPGIVAATLALYAEHDLLCYHAASPAALVAAQHAAWQPWLEWAAIHYGARFRTTSELKYLEQDAAALSAIHAALIRCGPEILAALALAIPALGSCILGLALAARAASPGVLFGASVTDELFQEQRWGTDDEACARRLRLKEEIALAARFMELCGAWEPSA